MDEKKGYVYRFFWGDDKFEEFFMKIWAEEDEVHKLYEEYTDADCEYDVPGWQEWLDRKGIKTECLPIDYEMFF